MLIVGDAEYNQNNSNGTEEHWYHYNRELWVDFNWKHWKKDLKYKLW